MIAAAGVQLTITAGGASTPAAAWWTMGLGPLLFLTGVAAFKRAAGARRWPTSHLAGLAALALLMLAGRGLPADLFALAAGAVLVLVALWETWPRESGAA